METLGGPSPKVIAVGRKPKAPKDVEEVIRGSRRTALRSAIDLALATKKPVDKRYETEGFRVVAEPFLSPLDRVNAVRVCAVELDEELPERLPTGAWVWDLNRATCLVSPEMYDVYKKPPELHLTEISRLESLYGVTSSAHRQAEALAKGMTGAHGTEVAEVWQIRRYDGVLRDMRFADRLEEVPGQRWLHGVTCDITEGESAIAPPLTFAESLVEAELASQVGAHSVLVDLRTLTAIRWLSQPLDSVQCERTGVAALDPAIHPDDVEDAKRLAAAIATSPAEGAVRVRDVHGGWVKLKLSAALMVLDRDSGAHAALVKLREADS